MRNTINITKALSDENRVRALMMLRNEELCLCQLIELFGLAPSTISKHMAILYQADLVDTRKDGRWNYYRLAGEDAPGYVLDAIKWVKESTNGNKQVIEDAKEVKRVCKIDKDKLCACYKKAQQKNNKSTIQNSK